MSEFAFQQEQSSYAEAPAGDESYGPGWTDEGGLDPLADPAVFDAQLRAMVDEQLAPHLQWVERQRTKKAFAKAGEELNRRTSPGGRARRR
jgi:hypothetical protein